MSLINRNSFILAIVMSLPVLWEATNVVTATYTVSRYAIPTKVRVEIYNELPKNASFVVHCKSRDNDLVSHVVGVGKHYGFGFSANIWGTTFKFIRNMIDMSLLVLGEATDHSDLLHLGAQFYAWTVGGSEKAGYGEQRGLRTFRKFSMSMMRSSGFDTHSCQQQRRLPGH
ncbi:hypothetical protein CRG98_015364 [Punica granatum]|uniref:S-protein homolog n=1 Tax=Punica granatum TaxID=22663 RepID=A0A2I0K6T4_PUNGR|nr:hypothetical protein CRG98_015364 [Punica granatum]